MSNQKAAAYTIDDFLRDLADCNVRIERLMVQRDELERKAQALLDDMENFLKSQEA